MGKRKKFDTLDFDKVIINLMGRKFSLKKEDDKKDVPVICDLLISRARQGSTLSMILFDLGIRQSMWSKFVVRNKKVQRAIADASAFHKAYGQVQLANIAKLDSREAPNAQIVKLLMANFYDIKEEHSAPVSKDNKPGSRYKVVTTMTETSKEEIVEQVEQMAMEEDNGQDSIIRATE